MNLWYLILFENFFCFRILKAIKMNKEHPPPYPAGSAPPPYPTDSAPPQVFKLVGGIVEVAYFEKKL